MGCFGCLKYILIIFAVGYVLVGLGLLAVALWMRFDYLKDAADAMALQDQQTDYMNIALYIAIGIGAFLVLLGILGCVGALRISLCLLGNFAVLVVAAIGGLIAVCVLAYLYQDDIINGVTRLIQQFFYQYGGINTARQTAIDGIQRSFKCCGVRAPVDWIDQNILNWRSVPASCCRSINACVFSGNINTNPFQSLPGTMNAPFAGSVNPNLVNGLGGPPPSPSDIFANINQIFSQGCADKLRANYKEAMQIIVGLSGGIAGFMLLGFVMCIAFCCVM